MTVLTLALLAGSQPAAPRLAPVHQIGPQSRRQSPHTPCAPLVRTDALTVTWQKADRYKRSAPTSSSHTPWPNPHSACGTAAAPLPAISCLGAFRPPAAGARGEIVVTSGRKPAQHLHNSRPEQMQQTKQAYSITSSARASSVGGISTPSVRAVSALMTKSNLVDCTMNTPGGEQSVLGDEQGIRPLACERRES